MNSKILRLLAIPAFLLAIVSCSDSEINSSDIPEISQSIFVVPENLRGEPYKSQYTSSDKFFVKINEKIRICGVYSINGAFISTDDATPYYNSHRWTIDNNEVNTSSSVYYSFDKAGIHEISFETVDHLGDTLVSHAQIYVNTPTAITLQSPANNYNQVDGKNENGIELSWSISGIDPWETSRCIVYASYDRLTVWDSPLGELDCAGSVNLMGELDAEINDQGDPINHSIDNSTIYWSVQADIKNENKVTEHAFSEIFSFSTKLKNNGYSVVEIPISCKFNQYPEKSILTGAFISSTGDTLFKIRGVNSNTVIRSTLDPGSNIKFVICDTIRKEYGCESTTFDLAASTKNVLDTLFLLDKVKPNMQPTKTELPTASKIQFFILDNGSGVNVSKNQAIINNDTLETKFEDNVLSFANTCKKECNLIITAEDYAHNRVPDVYWKIKVNGSETKIYGPFASSEEEL